MDIMGREILEAHERGRNLNIVFAYLRQDQMAYRVRALRQGIPPTFSTGEIPGTNPKKWQKLPTRGKHCHAPCVRADGLAWRRFRSLLSQNRTTIAVILA